MNIFKSDDYKIKEICVIKVVSFRFAMIFSTLLIGFISFLYIKDLSTANNGTYISLINFIANTFKIVSNDFESMMRILVGAFWVFQVILIISTIIYFRSRYLINTRFFKGNEYYKKKHLDTIEISNKKIWSSVNFWIPLNVAVLLFGFTYNFGPPTPTQIDPNEVKLNVTEKIELDLKEKGYSFMQLSDKEIVIDNCLTLKSSEFFVFNKDRLPVQITLECDVPRPEDNILTRDTKIS